VDLQVDVQAPLPDGAELVTLCIAEGPSQEFAATTGRFALAGLFPDVVPELTADVRDVDGILIGRVGPMLLEESYMLADYVACDECDACESMDLSPPEGEPSWALALRFW
jgi:hypothetical protein